MNLVKFLLLASLTSLILGEFGHYPFGAAGASLSILDILVGSLDLFFVIWIVISKTKINIPLPFLLIGLFWAIAFVSLVFSIRLFPALEILTGGLYFIRFIVYSLTLIVIFTLLKSKNLSLERIIDWLINVGVVIAFLGFAQLATIPSFDAGALPLTDFGFDPHQDRLTSTFLDPNFVGAYLVVIEGLIFYQLTDKKDKLVWIILFLINFIAIILTYSRSAYLMAIISGLAILFINRRLISNKFKKILLVGTIASAISLLLLFPRFYSRVAGGLIVDQSASERISSWQAGFRIFESSPLIGVGFDNVRVAKENLNLFQVYSPDGGHSGAGIDSSLIFVLATTGVLGFSIFMTFWLLIFARLWRKKNVLSGVILALLLGLMVESQFVNSLFFPSIMLTYWLLVGLGLAVGDGDGVGVSL